jgi:hypothetical protein
MNRQYIRKHKENDSVAGEGEDTSAQFLQRFRVAQIWQIITTKCGEGIPRGWTFRDQVALVWGKELLNLLRTPLSSNSHLDIFLETILQLLSRGKLLYIRMSKEC